MAMVEPSNLLHLDNVLWADSQLILGTKFSNWSRDRQIKLFLGMCVDVFVCERLSKTNIFHYISSQKVKTPLTLGNSFDMATFYILLLTHH